MKLALRLGGDRGANVEEDFFCAMPGVPQECAFAPRSLRCPTQGWQQRAWRTGGSSRSWGGSDAQKWQSSEQTQGAWKKRKHWNPQGEEGAEWKRQKRWEKEPETEGRGHEQTSGNRAGEQGWQTAGDRKLGQTERGREQKPEKSAREVQRKTDAEQGRKREDRRPETHSADTGKNEGQQDTVEKETQERDPYDHVSGRIAQPQR